MDQPSVKKKLRVPVGEVETPLDLYKLWHEDGIPFYISAKEAKPLFETYRLDSFQYLISLHVLDRHNVGNMCRDTWEKPFSLSHVPVDIAECTKDLKSSALKICLDKPGPFERLTEEVRRLFCRHEVPLDVGHWFNFPLKFSVKLRGKEFSGSHLLSLPSSWDADDEIFVKTLTGKTVTVRVHPFMLVDDLRAQYVEKECEDLSHSHFSSTPAKVRRVPFSSQIGY